MPGAAVIAADGARLGTVAETSGSYFRVDAPMRRDYWLSCDQVTTSDLHEVTLAIARGDVDGCKLDQPGLEPEDDPLRDIARSPAILTEDEQLEQRVRMERELADQRRELPIHEGAGAGGTIGEPVEVEVVRLETVFEDVLPQKAAAASTGAMIGDAKTKPTAPMAGVHEFDEENGNSGAPFGRVLAIAVGLITAGLFIRRLKHR
jgi:hypothetical protein